MSWRIEVAAYQATRSLRGVSESSEHLGKTAGKDLREHKATYPALYGLDHSRRKAHLLADEAIDFLRDLGDAAEPLRGIARFIVDRSS